MKGPRVLVVSLLTGGAAAGCSDVSVSTGNMAGAAVTAVAPAPNAVGVVRGDTLRMTFNMPVDTASCRARFTLHLGDSTGAAVSGRMLFGSGYQQMMLVPDAMLQAGTRYFAMMRDSVMMGNGMGGVSMQGMMGGTPMMMLFTQMPAGAMRTGSGMGWFFTTGG